MIKSLPLKIKKLIRDSSYISTPLSIFVNPYYILRDSLYQNILAYSHFLQGDLLDVGCGSKPYKSLFGHVQSYVGVDISTSSHDQTRTEIDFFYDGKILPFTAESFDSVVSFEVFEHVFELPDLLIEISRILKPGGLLLVSIPFAYEEHGCPSDFARYTSDGLSYILEKHGFDVLRLSKTTPYFLSVCQLFLAFFYQNLALRLKLLHGLFFLFIFPFNVIAFGMQRILPKNYNYYCNCVMLAQKKPL